MNRKRYFVEAQIGAEKDRVDFIELREATDLVKQLVGSTATKILIKESVIDELDNLISEKDVLEINNGDNPNIVKNEIDFNLPEQEAGVNFLHELGSIEFDLERIDLVNKFRESELNSEELAELERLIKLYWEVKEQSEALPVVTEIARVLGIVEDKPIEDGNDEYFLVYEFDDGSEYPVNKKVGLGEAVKLAKEGFISNDFKKITIKGVKESYELTADTINTVDKLLEGLAANAFNDEVFDKAMKENEDNRAKEEEFNIPTDIDKPKKVGKLDQKGSKEMSGELNTYNRDGKIVKESLSNIDDWVIREAEDIVRGGIESGEDLEEKIKDLSDDLTQQQVDSIISYLTKKFNLKLEEGKVVKEELNKGEYQQYEAFDSVGNTIGIFNIKRSTEEVIEHAKNLNDIWYVSKIKYDEENEIVDEEVIWEDIEESKKPKLESSLKEKDLTFRQLRNIMKKSKAYGDGTEDRIADLLTANKANLDDKAPKRIVDRVLRIIGKNNINLKENFEPFMFNGDDGDYFRDTAESILDEIKNPDTYYLLNKLGEYETLREFVDNEFSLRLLGAWGSPREMDELYRYFKEQAPQLVKLGIKLWGEETNEAYKIGAIKIDSQGNSINPHDKKEFDTRQEARDYLKRHPGAKGAKIVKEAYPRSYKKVVVKNLEEYKNFVNNWNGESTEVEVWLTPTSIISVGFTTIKGQRPQYQVPTGKSGYVSYPDIEGAKRVAITNAKNIFYTFKESKMIKIQEELEDDERAQALANYLEVDVDTITNPYGNTFETEDGEEYLVLTEEEAREEAEQSIEGIFDDLGLESFTPSFQDWILENAVDQDWFEDAMRESYDNYIGDIRDEEDNVFENRLISEMVDEGILTEDDFDNWGEDSPTVKEDIEMWSKEEEYLDKLCDQDAVEWYKDNFGLTDFKDVIKENPNIIDMEEVVSEAISIDGISHFIATYDGSEIELENGYYAYRTN